MKPTYRNSEIKRREIDGILHQCAVLFQNLGKESTKEERNAAEAEEIRLLKSVRYLDEEFIDSCLFK